MALCVNCNIALHVQFQHYIATDLSADMVDIIEEWISREITNKDLLCKECFNFVTLENAQRLANPNSRGRRQLGHPFVCVWCGLSLSRRRGRRSRPLPVGQVERDYIANIVHPRQIPSNDAQVCNACWQRARNAVRQDTNTSTHCFLPDCINIQLHQLNPDSRKKCELCARKSLHQRLSQSTRNENTDQPVKDDPDVIQNQFTKLSDYIRAPEISHKCFVETCKVEEVEKASYFMRVSLLKQCKFFIPKICLVCSKHKTDWDFMVQPMEEIHYFKPEHVAGMLRLMSGKS